MVALDDRPSGAEGTRRPDPPGLSFSSRQPLAAAYQTGFTGTVSRIVVWPGTILRMGERCGPCCRDNCRGHAERRERGEKEVLHRKLLGRYDTGRRAAQTR